jgi:Family of unknown function (DUF6644)
MLPAFQWLQQSWLGTAINNSNWAFAAVEAGHLLALAAIGGAVVVVDLRLMGWAFRRQPVSEIARSVQPWLVLSLIGMFLTGIPLLASLAATKYYFNEPFRWKMYLLGAAMLFTFTIRRYVVMKDEARVHSAVAKATAIISIMLWSGVGIMGRGIGFY